MNKKYKIFVSSTYQDLKEERQMAIDTIMKLGHIPAGMELFSATGENQFEAIKPIIYDSDYYLLILAGKYGTVSNETGLSFTEMEYDYAVQNNKRVIAFVHDDPHNLPSDFRETKSKSVKKFEKFRQKVMNNKLVKMWHDTMDLVQSIPVSISTVVDLYPASTFWIHVNENDNYTPVDNYVALKDELKFNMARNEALGTYFYNMEKSVLVCEPLSGADGMRLIVDLPAKNSYIDEFAGCYMKMFADTRDWAQYVLNDYYLSFRYRLYGNMDMRIWIEIKGNTVEMCKQPIELIAGEEREVLVHLKEFLDDLHSWKKVKEVCFVFRPEDKKISCTVDIINSRLVKNVIKK